MDETQLIDQAVQYVRGEPCILCGRDDPFGNIGVFMPNDSQSWGAPEDKQRLIFYLICCECRVSPDANERIEGALALSMGLVSVC